MHSDWFNRIEILQGRWQHGEKVGYRYPSGPEKTLCKWDVYVLLVTKGLMCAFLLSVSHLFLNWKPIQFQTKWVYTIQELIHYSLK